MAKWLVLAGLVGFLLAIGPPHHLQPFQSSLRGLYAGWAQMSARSDTAWHGYLVLRQLAAEGNDGT